MRAESSDPGRFLPPFVIPAILRCRNTARHPILIGLANNQSCSAGNCVSCLQSCKCESSSSDNIMVSAEFSVFGTSPWRSTMAQRMLNLKPTSQYRTAKGQADGQ